MKSNKMLTAALLVAALLILVAVPSMAAPGETNLFQRSMDGSSMDISVNSIAAVDDTLYVLTYNGIYTWKVGMDEPLFSTIGISSDGNTYYGGRAGEEAELSTSLSNLMGGDALYGYDGGSGIFYALSQQEDAWHTEEIYRMTAMDRETITEGNEEMYFWPRSVSYDGDGTLALLMEMDNGSDGWWNYTLFTINTETGDVKRHTDRSFKSIIPYREGKFLCFSYDESYYMGGFYTADEIAMPKIVVYDPATEAATTLFEVNNSGWGCIAYDAEADIVYIVGEGQVHAWKTDTGLVPVSYVPVSYAQYSDMAVLLSGGYIVSTPNSNGVYVRSTDPTLMPTQVLRISGASEYDEDVRGFVAANPALPIHFVNTAYQAESIGQQIQTGADSADIYAI